MEKERNDVKQTPDDFEGKSIGVSEIMPLRKNKTGEPDVAEEGGVAAGCAIELTSAGGRKGAPIWGNEALTSLKERLVPLSETF